MTLEKCMVSWQSGVIPRPSVRKYDTAYSREICTIDCKCAMLGFPYQKVESKAASA